MDYDIVFGCRKFVTHSLAALTRKIFLNTRREISYLRAVISRSVYYMNTNEVHPVGFSPCLSLLSEPREEILEQFRGRT